MFEELVRNIAAGGIERDPPGDGDYLNEEGLLMCGKCHTPRRMYIHINGNRLTVPISCKCRKETYKKEMQDKINAEIYESVMSLRKASIIDDKFIEASFDDSVVQPDNERQMNLCKRYAEKFDILFEKNQGLLLYGNVGTGKSHIAACVCNHLIDAMTPVYATSFVKLLEGNPKDVDIPGIIKRMEDAKLVLFDDLGAERKTDYAQEVVYDLIDSRYRQRKPMIVTTNLSLNDMKTATDIRVRRIYDRVLECCYPVQFNGQSFRMREAAKRFDEMNELLRG